MNTIIRNKQTNEHFTLSAADISEQLSRGRSLKQRVNRETTHNIPGVGLTSQPQSAAAAVASQSALHCSQPVSIENKRELFQLYQNIVSTDRLAFFHVDNFHLALFPCRQTVLHLHSFKHQHFLTFSNLVANFNSD